MRLVSSSAAAAFFRATENLRKWLPSTGEEPMRKTRFTEEEDGCDLARGGYKQPAAAVSRRHKISEQTIYNWRQHFGSLEPVNVACLAA